MKKLLALILALLMVLTFVACDKDADTDKKAEETTKATEKAEPTEEAPAEEPTEEPAPEQTEEPTEIAVMTYAEFMAAETDAKVCIESYIQAAQSWWEDEGQGKMTLYLQDEEGAYFSYETAVPAEQAEKLVPGTKVRLTGVKAEWSGEIEIMYATAEIIEAEPFTAEPTDVTALMGTEELEAQMNKLVTVKGMTFKSLSYKDNEWDKDIYVTLTLGDAEYTFCVENYLTGPETDLYKAVEALKEGDKIDVTGFLYWYETPNTHITAIEPAA